MVAGGFKIRVQSGVRAKTQISVLSLQTEDSIKQQAVCSVLAGSGGCVCRAAPEEQGAAGPSAAAALPLVSDLFGELELHQPCTNKGIRKQTASPGLQSSSVWV